MNSDGIYDDFFNPDANQFKLNSLKISCEYYTEDKFNTLCHSLTDGGHVNDFSSFHLNINSISKKFDALNTYLSTIAYPFSVMAFSETKLTEATFNLFPLPNFNAFHSYRTERVGVGVSLYVSNIYECIPRHDVGTECNSTFTESIFIEIPTCQQFNGKSLLIGCIYRPPDSDINTFNDALQSTLESITKESKLCLLLGDWNVNLLKCTSHSASADFLNTLYSFNFFPSITMPTRIKPPSATLIDNIIFNSLDYEITSGILLCDISDHFPVIQFIHSTTSMTNSPRRETPKYRKFSKKNLEVFKAVIGNISWDEVLQSQDPHKTYATFLESFNSALDKAFPLVTSKSKNNHSKGKPWITDDLKKLSRKKKNFIGSLFYSLLPITLQHTRNAKTTSMLYQGKQRKNSIQTNISRILFRPIF